MQPTNKIWVLDYEINWGTRLERSHREFYFSFRPTERACCDFLNREGITRDAKPSWFGYGPLTLSQYEGPLIRDKI